MQVVTIWSSVTFSVASLNSLSSSVEISLSVTTTSVYTLMCWSFSDFVRWLKEVLDKVSATSNCLPGASTAITLNLTRHIGGLWRCTGTLSRSHAFISGTSGLWLVWREKLFIPYIYFVNRSQDHTAAKHSFTIWEYRFSTSVTVYEQKATHLQQLCS